MVPFQYTQVFCQLEKNEKARVACLSKHVAIFNSQKKQAQRKVTDVWNSLYKSHNHNSEMAKESWLNTIKLSRKQRPEPKEHSPHTTQV